MRGRAVIRAAGTIVAVVCVALLSANTTTAHAAVANVAVPVPLCCPLDEIAAAGGLVALSSDESRGELIRIDPSTNAITATAEFPDYPPDGDVADVQNLVYAAGSVWFAAYFADVVYRVNPITLRVQDRIRIGRSPNGLVLADELLWTPLSNGRAVAAIDPVTAKVVRRVPVGDQNVATDGPLKPSWDGTSVLVALPGSGRVAHISPTTFGVTYDQVGPDVSCSNVGPGSRRLLARRHRLRQLLFPLERRRSPDHRNDLDRCLLRRRVPARCPLYG